LRVGWKEGDERMIVIGEAVKVMEGKMWL